MNLAPGDRVDATLQATRVENRYEWLWAAAIRSADGSEKARFRQSTFATQAWTPETLRKQMPTHAPELSAQGVLNRFILSQVDGQHTVAEIAAIVAAHHPERFASSSAALPWVSDVVQQYCT